VKAMTAMPITAIARAITGGGGTLTGRFIDGYLIAMRPKTRDRDAKIDVTQPLRGRGAMVFFANPATRAG
jgi:hypothetical protein